MTRAPEKSCKGPQSGEAEECGVWYKVLGSPSPASSSPTPFHLLDILVVPHGSSLNEAFLGVKGMVLKTDRSLFYPGSVTE